MPKRKSTARKSVTSPLSPKIVSKSGPKRRKINDTQKKRNENINKNQNKNKDKSRRDKPEIKQQSDNESSDDDDRDNSSDSEGFYDAQTKSMRNVEQGKNRRGNVFRWDAYKHCDGKMKAPTTDLPKLTDVEVTAGREGKYEVHCVREAQMLLGIATSTMDPTYCDNCGIQINDNEEYLMCSQGILYISLLFTLFFHWNIFPLYNNQQTMKM